MLMVGYASSFNKSNQVKPEFGMSDLRAFEYSIGISRISWRDHDAELLRRLARVPQVRTVVLHDRIVKLRCDA